MRALWKGQVPLARAFWEYGIVYMLVANLCATGASLAMIAADLPAPLVIAVFLLPVPYIVVAVVGVWRSADAYPGPRYRATMARYSALVWGTLMVLT